MILASMTMVNGAKAACPNNQTCGENCCWDLTKGVLSISTDDKTKSGEMINNGNGVIPPWYNDSASIQSIVIEGKDEVSGTKGITNIGVNAFSGAYNLTSITIPDSVTSIKASAFRQVGLYSGLTSITIPDSVTSIEASAFQNSSFRSITLPDNLTNIGDSAFSDLYSLTSITIPDGVTSIGVGTFQRAYNLTSVTLPDSLTSIGNEAFADNRRLESLTIPDSLTSIGNNAFKNVPSTAVIYCQEGSGKHGGKSCADLVASSTNFQGAIQLYTKDSDGNMILYDKNGDGTITSNGETYDSVDAMLTALATPPEPEPVVTPEPTPGTQTETSDINGSFGTAERGKRIYTVQQANEVAGKKNRVMIRYK